MVTEIEFPVAPSKYVVVGKTFRDSSFELAGIRFEDCTFITCRFVYLGDAFVDFQNCTFRECDWVFDGPAENTLVFLSRVYHGLGEEGRNLVEAIFDSIRSGNVGETVRHQFGHALSR